MVGASGSSAERKSAHTFFPFLRPNRSLASSRTSAEPTSFPPPRPKIPATSEAVAITSVTFQLAGPWGRPSAAYSLGILSTGLTRASAMYWLTPST